MSDEMTPEELAELFGEPVPVISTHVPDLYVDNGIYQIAGRIKNHVSSAGFLMTPNSQMVANTYAHMCFAFYQFALTLPQDKRVELEKIIRAQEEGAANLISAAHRQIDARPFWNEDEEK